MGSTPQKQVGKYSAGKYSVGKYSVGKYSGFTRKSWAVGFNSTRANNSAVRSGEGLGWFGVNAVAMMSQWCRNPVAMLLQCCRNVVAMLRSWLEAHECIVVVRDQDSAED